ncbi:hypothetical protein FAGAP_12849 [Fusarium agapanthi]|uniref:Uncharacterized protein n=1 Tax=Fusarium agapanthi TaxID=1803897 RepID=A0A9P5B2Z5_9HYPO|nr:hypothetical protein FAGAP_12849 [Fusarium agapanthi]
MTRTYRFTESLYPMGTNTTSIDAFVNRIINDADRMADDADRMADCANHVDHKKSVVARNGGGIIIGATVIGGRQINQPSDSVRIVNPLVLGGVQVNRGETDNGDVNGEFERHQSSTGTAAEDYPTQWNGGSMVINLKRADDKKT